MYRTVYPQVDDRRPTLWILAYSLLKDYFLKRRIIGHDKYIVDEG